jgi:hypothetical protein
MSSLFTDIAPEFKRLKDNDFNRFHETGLPVAEEHDELLEYILTQASKDIIFLKTHNLMDYSVVLSIVQHDDDRHHKMLDISKNN